MAALNFSCSEADVFVPGGGDPEAALTQTTHLCIAAHQDDIEIMAHSGIAECFGAFDRHFTGVVVTNGAGSPRTGTYALWTDEEMQTVRKQEQRRAAAIGRYGLQIQLGHSSAAVKSAAAGAAVREDLVRIFSAVRPVLVYLHNPADKHDTHVALLLRCLEAIRSLPPERRPPRVLGCEVWRALDWLTEVDKVALDAGRMPELAEALLRAFESQISGGKRYDLATLGRRAANATFQTAHSVDQHTAVTWAMDLTELVHDPELDVRTWIERRIARLAGDVRSRLDRLR